MEEKLKSCKDCGICEARKMLSGDTVAVLVGPGVIKTYTSLEKSEENLIFLRDKYPDTDFFLIRRDLPEHMKSYNLVDDNEDIPY